MTIDTDYLLNTIDRLAILLTHATPDVQVFTYIEPKANPPFWWIYLGPPNELADTAFEMSLDKWTFALRYVIGFSTEGYDGRIERKMYADLGKAKVYLMAHKRLIDEVGQAGLKYMVPDAFLFVQASNFGVFTEDNHVGVELGLTLGYRIQIEQEF